MKELTPEIDHCAYQLAIFVCKFDTRSSGYILGTPLSASFIATYLNTLGSVVGWTIDEARVNEIALLHAFVMFKKYLKENGFELDQTYSKSIGTPCHIYTLWYLYIAGYGCSYINCIMSMYDWLWCCSCVVHNSSNLLMQMMTSI